MSREGTLASHVANMVATCAAFQEWAEVDDAPNPVTAARAFGHIDTVFSSDWTLPGYLVSVENVRYPRETTTGFNLWPEGEVVVMFEGEVDATDEEADASIEASMLAFKELVRGVKEDFMALAELPQWTQFKEVREMEGPAYIYDTDEAEVIQRGGARVIGFRWGFIGVLTGGG